jgi:hypothetical protein
MKGTPVSIREKSLKAGVLAASAILLGSLAGALSNGGNQALANTNCTHPNSGVNTMAQEDGGSSNHRGNRSRALWVEQNPASDPQCTRVSSLFLTTEDHTFWVEIGWVDASLNPGVCGYSLSSGADVFDTKTDGNGYSCHNDGEVASGDYGTYQASMSVNSPTANGTWDFWYEGTEVHTRTLTSNSPTVMIPATNGERHDNGDSAWSDFKTLEFMNGGGWNAWVSPGKGPVDDDNGYCQKLYSSDPTHTSVFVAGNC